MTWFATGAMVVTTLIAADGQQKSAEAQAGQARVAGHAALYEGALDKAMRDKDAAAITLSAQADADNIKRQSMLMRSQMAVSQSGSGVMIGEGSAQAAMEQLDALSSADALAALYSGVNKSSSVRAGGQFAAEAGKQRNIAAGQAAADFTQAGNTAMTVGVLSAAGGIAKGYGSTTTKTPTKAA